MLLFLDQLKAPAPPAPSDCLHLPLVASSLRVAFERKRHVFVMESSDAVELYHHGTRIAEIPADGEMFLYQVKERRTKRRKHLNRMLEWIGADERVTEQADGNWTTDGKVYEEYIIVTHRNAYEHRY